MRNQTTTSSRTELNRGGDGFERRLMRLSEMDGYQVSSGDPDVRGWTVRTRDGTTIGTVDTLVIDTEVMKARYIEVELDRSTLKLDQARCVTLPIGSARLDDDNDVVLLPEHSPAEVTQLPPSARVIDRDAEQRIRSSSGVAGSGDQDFYRDPRYDDQRFFGNRRRGREHRDYITRLGEQSMSEESLRLSQGRRH